MSEGAEVLCFERGPPCLGAAPAGAALSFRRSLFPVLPPRGGVIEHSHKTLACQSARAFLAGPGGAEDRDAPRRRATALTRGPTPGLIEEGINKDGNRRRGARTVVHSAGGEGDACEYECAGVNGLRRTEEKSVTGKSQVFCRREKLHVRVRGAAGDYVRQFSCS